MLRLTVREVFIITGRDDTSIFKKVEHVDWMNVESHKTPMVNLSWKQLKILGKIWSTPSLKHPYKKIRILRNPWERNNNSVIQVKLFHITFWTQLWYWSSYLWKSQLNFVQLN
jgi:hypothetical protein